MKLAISGASGKTGFRIAEEAKRKGYEVRLIVRKNSVLPESLLSNEIRKISLFNQKELDSALSGCEALVIATGARPSIDLTGPARIDACGVRNQVESCNRVGLKRVVLVSSLCAGKLLHPLNLFGLILIWKSFGEKALEESGLNWTIIRPGGLNEIEDNLDKENVFLTGKKQQEEGSIPRRLVAKQCIEALETKTSINKTLEITSNQETKRISMKKAIEALI